jgi:excisionase family DNA binding protein
LRILCAQEMVPMSRSHPPAAPQARPDSELLTVTQVAELLCVSARTVWQLAREGELTPVRLRRYTRWGRAAVMAYIGTLACQGGRHA